MGGLNMLDMTAFIFTPSLLVLAWEITVLISTIRKTIRRAR